MELSNEFKRNYTTGFHPQLCFKKWPQPGDICYLRISNVSYYVRFLEDQSNIVRPIFKVQYLSKLCANPITVLEGIPFNSNKPFTWIIYQYNSNTMPIEDEVLDDEEMVDPEELEPEEFFEDPDDDDED